MRKTNRTIFGSILSVALLLVSGMLYQRTTYAAVPSIVINEIQYNHQGGSPNHDFLELYNTSASPVDMSGWCFTAGITLCFSPGTSLAGHSYGVVSPNATESLIMYQVYTIGTYTGNLSNSGETVTLSDNLNQAVDTVTYSDSSPWPVSADGGGHSLELKDPLLDNSLASSWGPSIPEHTAGRVNSLVGVAEPPAMSNLVKPSNISAAQTALVTVEVHDANAVELAYKVMFAADITIPMNDSGVDGDVTAGDDVYSAVIPAQAAGKLVRYKITASNSSVATTLPNFNETLRNYDGYVVSDPNTTSNLPILQWFMNDTDYEDMVTNHVYDDVYLDCVLAYGDQVFDNTKVRVKGELSLEFPKKSFKFKLPKTSKINIPGKTPRPLNEFHMNAEWLDDSKARTVTLWEMAKDMGIATPAAFGTRLTRNNNYQGYFLFLEKYEKEYIAEKGLNGSLYEDNVPISDAANNDELADWEANMLMPRSTPRRQYVLDNNNIPNIINTMAFESSINNIDWHKYNNLFIYKDSKGSSRTERWSLLPWDLDLAFERGVGKIMISPYTSTKFTPLYGRFMATSLYDEPDLRAMFFRRLRTYVDRYYASDQLLTAYRDNAELAQVEAQLDLAKWGTGDGEYSTAQQQWYETNMKDQKQDYLVRYRSAWAIPAQQTSAPVVTIDQINNSLTANEQFIKLTNTSGEAIDMSGWRLDQLNYTLPAGSVIAGGSSAYIVRNDRASRLATPGRYVIGQLGANLPASGTLSLVRQNSTIADSEFY